MPSARACDEKRYDLLTQVFAPKATLDYRVAGHDVACRDSESFQPFPRLCYWTGHLIAHPTVEVFHAERRARSPRVPVRGA